MEGRKIQAVAVIILVFLLLGAVGFLFFQKSDIVAPEENIREVLNDVPFGVVIARSAQSLTIRGQEGEVSFTLSPEVVVFKGGAEVPLEEVAAGDIVSLTSIFTDETGQRTVLEIRVLPPPPTQ